MIVAQTVTQRLEERGGGREGRTGEIILDKCLALNLNRQLSSQVLQSELPGYKLEIIQKIPTMA